MTQPNGGGGNQGELRQYPFPPLTTTDPVEIADALSARVGDAWDRLEAERQLVLASVDLGRNQLVLEQLAEFQKAADEFQRVVVAVAEEFAQRRIPAIYATGAQAADPRETFVWTQSDIDAATSLASDSYGDFLRRSQEAGRTTQRFARQLRRAARHAVPASATGHMTSVQAAEVFRKELEEKYAISAATYADGSIHTMREYTKMAVLTKGAVARNYGLVNRAAASGVRFVEVFDGPSCGWTAHDDPQIADGTIRTLEEALAYPIAHPRCQRAFGARPDLRTKEDVKRATPSTTAEQRAERRRIEDERLAQRTPRPLRPKEAERARKATTRAARRQGATARDLQQAIANLVKRPPDADAMDQLMQHASSFPGSYLADRDPVATDALVRATYEMAWPSDGIQFGTKVSSVSFVPGPQTVVRGDILADRAKVGSFITRFGLDNGELRVHHELVELAEEFQGHSFSTAFMQWTEAFYRTHGVEAIRLTAAGGGTDVGGYVWARAGFDWWSLSDALKAADALDELARTDPAIAVRAHALALRLRRGAIADLPTPYEVSELGHDDPNADTWPGREMMKSLTWDGVFWLPR